MKKLDRWIFINGAAAVLLLASASAFAQIYVSPRGSDNNQGTQAKPVHTLQHALALAKAGGEKQIFLAGGIYRMHSPLELSSADSGISYAAEAGQSPVLSGAVRVMGWKLVDAEKNLWSAAAPSQLTNSRQLYVNGVRAERTRGRVPAELQMTPTGYKASNDVMATWKNPADIEFVYTGGNSIWSEHTEGLGSWTEPRCPIASIHGTTITMVQPCWNNSTKRVMLPSGVRTANLVGPMSVGKEPEYVENAYELLGTPGQWYFDRTTRTIYYVPRHGEDLSRADVEIPVLQTLVVANGTAAHSVHDITFQGIQFSYATWLGPSSGEGFSEIQANYQVTGPHGYDRQGLCKLVPDGDCPYASWTKEPGNVDITYGQRVRFLQDDFVHLGAAGLNLGVGSQQDVVEGCIFTDISGDGLELGTVNAPLAPDAEFTLDNRIDNNLFENVGAEYHGGIPIVVGYARHTLIAHNQIDHVPYAAISMGWGGWPDKIQQAGQANRSGYNVVKDNLIHNFMLVLSDGGGIYTQGRTGKDLSDGEQIVGNVIYNQYSSGHGIYTDNGSSMITIRGNVIFHTNHDNWNSRHRDYYDGQKGENFDPLDVEGNWWQQGDADSSAKQVTVRGNHLIDSLRQAPAAVVDNAGLQPAFRSLLQRRFTAVTAPEAPSRVAAYAGNGFADITWSPSIFDSGSPVTSYLVVASNGARATLTADALWKKNYVKMNGLQNGKQYTFTVFAKNAAGSSPASLPSRVVVPSDAKVELPQAPVGVSAHADNGDVSIHFQAAPMAKGKSEQSPVVAYVVTISPGGRKVYFTGRNVIALHDGHNHTTFDVISGLKRGTAYTFHVSAVNSAGDGPATVAGPVTIP